MRWIFDRVEVGGRCRTRHDVHQWGGLELHAGGRERRSGGPHTAIDAGAVVLVLAGRVRVARRAVSGVMTGGRLTGVLAVIRERKAIEPGAGQLRGRARVHRTDAQHRWFAHTEDEPDGEKCAKHAGREMARHSIGNYVDECGIGIFRFPEGWQNG